ALYTVGESSPATLDITYSSADEIATDGLSIVGGNGEIIIAGAEGRDVKVFAVDSRLVAAVTGADKTVLPLSSGVYIVTVGETTAKVSVR
ncbi:MAG: hypothetical protein K2J07_00505, partial [Muribaculaceae bacterium]|nr:hypothetical protein [Muribaculaceae bacterium]